MSRTALAMSLLVLCLGGAGCGSDGEQSGGGPTSTPSTSTAPATTPPTTSTGPTRSSGSAADIAAVRAAITAWAHADTPQEVCALMSASFERKLLGNDTSACRSKEEMESKLGIELTSSELETTSVRVTGEKAVAHTTGGSDDVYTLVREGRSWKIDKIDRPQPKIVPQETVTQEPVT